MTLHEKRCRRAKMGLYLSGPLPSADELRWKFRITRGTAHNWRMEIKRARKEFA